MFKTIFLFCCCLIFGMISGNIPYEKTKIIGDGRSPQITIDPKGTVRIIFGGENKIFYTESNDEGMSFSRPALVAVVDNMHLGMSRGPQLATSNNFSIISAIDKAGNIHTFVLNHHNGNWEKGPDINDESGSAPEGLMSLVSDGLNSYYAIWLDTRRDRHNKIGFSRTTDNGGHWEKNRLIYISPDSTVCECCKPNLSVSENKIAVMFRNWLNGSRDMYLIESFDKGQSFGQPRKIGLDTWKLNGCPMDGGGINMNAKGEIITFWQRKGTIHKCLPEQKEEEIGNGRSCTFIDRNGPVWQDGDSLKFYSLATQKTLDIAMGHSGMTRPTPDGKNLIVWEKNKQIMVKKF